MADPNQVKDMLLTEHLRFTPIALIDDIINTVNERTYSAIELIESTLRDSTDPSLLGFDTRAQAEGRIPETDEEGKPVFPEARLEIEEGAQKLETLLENTIDKNFDKFEIYTLRNVLTVPGELVGWVRLGHYENLTIPPANPQITPETLVALRRKLIETQKLRHALLRERSRNEAVLTQLRALLSPSQPPKTEPRSSTSPEDAPPPSEENKPTFTFLTHNPSAQALGIQPIQAHSTTTAPVRGSAEPSGPLTTHTTFTLSQLPHLRSQLEKLRPYVSASALPKEEVGRKGEVMRERREYVEGQSRRVLERRGVDVRGGAMGGLDGGRVGGEEVRGLEALVEGMGREGGDGEEMDTS